jgi:UDP-4-amino-4,6-dideoxy-N-acetyl-beta-L-altrosamine transaminase
MSDPFLPYGRQSIDEADIEAVAQILRGDFLTTGPAVPEFEAAFCAATGARHAIACSSGTAALHLALAGLGVGEGDVCIVPAITFAATANAALYGGAEVEFADVDPDTGLLTPDTLAAAHARAGGRAKAILPVHLAGQTVELEAISAFAREAGLHVVEDACHAVGTRHGGGRSGDNAYSDAATFSLHPVKTIAAGEGGVVTVKDADLADRLRQLRSHGIERDPAKFESGADEPWRQEMQALGWNYRLTDMQAALGRSQLSKLPLFARRRQELADLYDAALAPLGPVLKPMARVAGCEPCWHLYAARIDFEAVGISRGELMKALKNRGIGTQVHYLPVPAHPFYRNRYGGQTPPGAARYYGRTLSLPLFYGMQDEDVPRVVAALTEVLGL